MIRALTEQEYSDLEPTQTGMRLHAPALPRDARWGCTVDVVHEPHCEDSHRLVVYTDMEGEGCQETKRPSR